MGLSALSPVSVRPGIQHAGQLHLSVVVLIWAKGQGKARALTRRGRDEPMSSFTCVGKDTDKEGTRRQVCPGIFPEAHLPTCVQGSKEQLDNLQ